MITIRDAKGRAVKDSTDIREKLLSKRVITATGCWELSGRKSAYPNIRYENRSISVHRLAAFLWKEFDLSSELEVLHSCDNNLCWNPDHLSDGTQLDNVHDCLKKGRGNKSTGDAHWKRKLSIADVIAIRKARASGISSASMALLYSVHLNTINMAIRGANWRDVA